MTYPGEISKEMSLKGETNFIPISQDELDLSLQRLQNEIDSQKAIVKEQMEQISPKKTPLDITSGSLDRRANAELAEIERMNDQNSRPANLKEYAEQAAQI